MPPVAAAPVAAAAPPVAAAPPPAPAPEFDLLDLGGPTDVAASAPAGPASDVVDIFGAVTLEPTPVVPVASPAAPSPTPLVETVSEDEEHAPPLAAAAPAPPPAVPVDPFAAEGLLGDFQETTLQGFGALTAKFEFHGSPMAPLQITTPQFGQHWGSCPATSPISINSKKVASLDAFMKECGKAGLHPIEAITVTNEGICGGMFDGGSKIILVHGKLTPLASGESNLAITVKSADPTLSGSLALYLQNMMK